MLRQATVFALALSLLAPAAAQAQATDQGADDIMAALTDWASDITGEKFTRAQIAAEIAIRPQGDHYVASLPLGAGPDAPHLTAAIGQSLDRWVIDDISVPDNATFRSVTGGHRVEFTADGQSGEVVLDNTYSTATLGNFAMTGVGLHFQTEGASDGALIQVGRALKTAILRPRLDGRNDFAVDAVAEQFSLRTEGAAPLKLDFDALRTAITLDGITSAATAKLLQAMANNGNPQRATDSKLPPGSVAAAFAGFTSAMTIGGAFDALSLDTGDVTGSVGSGKLGLDAAQQNGLVHGALQIEADALAFASPRLGPAAALLPTRFRLHQTAANLPVAALLRLAALTDAGSSPAPEDLQRLFAAGGIQISLDDFLLELGGATFTATGKSVLTAPQEGTVTATVTAVGLDLLQQRLLADPVLAKGVPVLIFLKGAGRTVDDRTIWDIAYRDRQLLVNNQNLSAMLQSFGGGAPH